MLSWSHLPFQHTFTIVHYVLYYNFAHSRVSRCSFAGSYGDLIFTIKFIIEITKPSFSAIASLTKSWEQWPRQSIGNLLRLLETDQLAKQLSSISANMFRNDHLKTSIKIVRNSICSFAPSVVLSSFRNSSRQTAPMSCNVNSEN